MNEWIGLPEISHNIKSPEIGHYIKSQDYSANVEGILISIVVHRITGYELVIEDKHGNTHWIQGTRHIQHIKGKCPVCTAKQQRTASAPA